MSDKKKSSKKEKNTPILLLLSVISLCMTSLFIAYFSPLLFPNLLNKVEFLREFKTHYDIRYKTSKGEHAIWLEFFIYIISYGLVFISFYKAHITNPGEVPDDTIWKLDIPSELTEKQKTDYLGFLFEQREEILLSNRNCINEKATEETNISNFCLDNTNEEEQDLFYHISDRTVNGTLRYCDKCTKYKPDRAHHCKSCNKCVLKLDHHCPWIGNCIGFNNHKYFVCLIFYGFLAAGLFNYIFRDITRFIIKEEKVITFKLVCFVVFYFFMILATIFLFFFNFFHLYIILNNFTTFEFIILNDKTRETEETSYVHYRTDKSRYNVGVWENFKYVLGANPFLWLLPYNTNKRKDIWNNGFNFKLNAQNEYEIIKSV